MLRLMVMMCVAAFAWQTHSPSAQAQDALRKRPLPPLVSPTCQQIEAGAGSFAEERTSKTTQYFTPIFQPGPDGGLRDQDRDNCLKMEGSCIVGRFLYNAGGPNGTRSELDKIKFIFGKGNGVSDFNKTNALFPYRALAADIRHYRVGTVIYIPSFKNKVCPQNGQPVDGCFIVGDVGAAIKGKGRFDLFTGECAAYDGRRHVCRDAENAAFNVPVGTKFHTIPRAAALAGAL
jgi:3D (Asp-Asp-Asp) domain-containing protein